MKIKLSEERLFFIGTIAPMGFITGLVPDITSNIVILFFVIGSVVSGLAHQIRNHLQKRGWLPHVAAVMHRSQRRRV